MRTGRLQPLGPHDVTATSWTRHTLRDVLEQLRTLRGELIVEAYRR